MQGEGAPARCMSCISGPQVQMPSLGTGVRHCSFWRVERLSPEACVGLLEVNRRWTLVLHAWPHAQAAVRLVTFAVACL